LFLSHCHFVSAGEPICPPRDKAGFGRQSGKLFLDDRAPRAADDALVAGFGGDGPNGSRGGCAPHFQLDRSGGQRVLREEVRGRSVAFTPLHFAIGNKQAANAQTPTPSHAEVD
jgi:hypothetical protein